MANDDLAEIDLSEDEVDAMIAGGEPVEVIGPPEPAAGVHVELLSPGPSTFGWRIVTAYGEILATSATHYSDRGAALRALRALVSAMQNVPIVDSRDDPRERIAG